MKTRQGSCPVCHRLIPMTKAGVLRLHLAARGTSQRQQCAGSAGHTAHWQATEEQDTAQLCQEPCSPAAAAAVLAEWELADALYREYKDMTELWACTDDAAESVRMAQNRAVDRARQLESQYPGWLYTDTSNTLLRRCQPRASDRYPSVTPDSPGWICRAKPSTGQQLVDSGQAVTLASRQQISTKPRLPDPAPHMPLDHRDELAADLDRG